MICKCNPALDKYWVTQIGYFRFATTVELGMGIIDRNPELDKYWVTQIGYFRFATTVELGMGITDRKL